MPYLICGGEEAKGRRVIVLTEDEDKAVKTYQAKYHEKCWTYYFDDMDYKIWTKHNPDIEQMTVEREG